MFGDLYDSISLLFSWRWPKAEAVINGVNMRVGDRGQAMVVYEFSVGNDGPNTGEAPWFGDTVFMNQLVGKKITVRYRKDNPSVNRIDAGRDDL